MRTLLGRAVTPAFMTLVTITLLACSACTSSSNMTSEEGLRATLETTLTGTVQLPSGEILISSEITLPPGAHDLEIIGDGTVLKASDDFEGRALLVIEQANNITVRNLAFDGNRGKLDRPFPIAPPENAFRIWYPMNGLLADQVEGLEIVESEFRNVVHFPILVSRSSDIGIHEVRIEDSGALNDAGRNNLSGGVLIEEGSTGFDVRDSTFRNIRGNGLWTHSLFTSPRLENGTFAQNRFDTIGRDALQVGQATRVTVEFNEGVNIGYPVEVVDVENDGIPVAVDTAGDVDESTYANNTFSEINGKCFDLDGFHDGEVRDNSCTNRGPADDYPTGHFGIVMNNTNPDTHSDNIGITGNTIDGAKYGGVFVMGSGNTISGNHLLNLNLAACSPVSTDAACLYLPEQPELLGSGIYLGRGVARLEQTEDNTIQDNEITGFGMGRHCIEAGPGVSLAANLVDDNQCRSTPPR